MENIKLSAVIVTLNEEKMLPECIKSLSWVDEIVVVDNGSTDSTVKIAKRAGARIVRYASKDFSDRRNKGMAEAKGDWVIYFDADERSTPELMDEVFTRLPREDCVAYAIPRKNYIFGKQFKYSGQYPDYQKRLFKKHAFRQWTGALHETASYKGRLGHFINPMIHIKHDTLSEMVEKTNNWSEIEAKLMFDAKHPPMNIGRFLSAIFREFWQRMIIQTAFLDGGEGIIYAMYQVFSRFVSYSKLWEMQIKGGIIE